MRSIFSGLIVILGALLLVGLADPGPLHAADTKKDPKKDTKKDTKKEEPKKEAPKPPPPFTGPPVTNEEANKAIDQALAYYWKTQNPTTGGWERYTPDEYEKDQKIDSRKQEQFSPGRTYSAQTALVLFAMRKAGVSPDDPKFQKALKFILENEPTLTYAHAVRAALFSTLDPTKYGPRLEQEKEWLLLAMHSDGTYSYTGADSQLPRPEPGSHPNYGPFDLSNTQYGVLGMWLISDSGRIEVPQKYWRMVQSAYTRLQEADGGWGYSHPDAMAAEAKAEGKGYQTMTLGGLASLYVVWDRLYTQNCDQPPDPKLTESINRGLKWLDKNFDPTKNAGTWHGEFVHYMIYGVERVGVASGLKYFGDRNWWDQCGRFVLSAQGSDGSWSVDHEAAPSPVTTAWMVLFLSYGRAPIVFNKLQYGDNNQWNAHPRDLARLTNWMTKVADGKPLNWQIMPISRPLDELLDAPILYMSGRGPLKLSDAEKAKIKDYVLSGGTLLADSGDKTFVDSFRSLIRELFPELELQPLPEKHAIFSSRFRLDQVKGFAAQRPLEGLTNGIRAMVLLSTKDLGCTWQQHEVVDKHTSFELGQNVADYVSDHGTGLHGRGHSYWVKDQGKKPARQITVGRLVWGGKYNWDPEPFAWKRMDILLRNADQMGVTTKECNFAAPVNPKEVPIMHLTGSVAVQLDATQKANLKQYVAGGGLLLADAAGGSPRFTEGFQKLAGELFGQQLKPAAPPFLAEATDSGKVRLRHINDMPQSTKALELLGYQKSDNTWGVLFLPYDLTAAMAGYSNVEPAGLTPAAAEKFMGALLNWAASK